MNRSMLNEFLAELCKIFCENINHILINDFEFIEIDNGFVKQNNLEMNLEMLLKIEFDSDHNRKFEYALNRFDDHGYFNYVLSDKLYEIRNLLYYSHNSSLNKDSKKRIIYVPSFKVEHMPLPSGVFVHPENKFQIGMEYGHVFGVNRKVLCIDIPHYLKK